jgi:hypothetical protein
MILSKEVELIWNNRYKKRYVDLGYDFTKCGDTFIVKIKDLDVGTHTKVEVKCDICGKENMIEYRRYITNYLNCDYYGCSLKCSQEKHKKTCLRNMGVEHPSQTELVKNKKKETCLKNHGCEHPMQNDDIKEKVKQTNIEKYGCEHPLQNDDIKEKIKQTNIEKYGVENPFQIESIKNKIKENIIYSNIKRKETCIKKYGCEYASQNIDVKNKMRETCVEKYGVEYVSQNVEIMEKIIQTNITLYGEAFTHLFPKYNINSIVYLDIISEILKTPIQHGVNGGEKKFQRYWVDGYIEQYNICFEWDEKYHNNIKIGRAHV